MGLGILSGAPIGALTEEEREAQIYPWHKFSRDTLELQRYTNQALQAAGLCPVPMSGVLDGATCGARNHLNIHAKEYFGEDYRFFPPLTCRSDDPTDPLSKPTAGCFQPTGKQGLLKLTGESENPEQTRRNWILMGGALSAVLAAVLLVKQRSA